MQKYEVTKQWLAVTDYSPAFMSNWVDSKYTYKSLLSRQTSARRKICFNSSGQIHSVAELFAFTSSTARALNKVMTASDPPTFTFFIRIFYFSIRLITLSCVFEQLVIPILAFQLLSHFLSFYIFLSQVFLTTQLFSQNSESKLHSFAVFGLRLKSLRCRQLNP